MKNISSSGYPTIESAGFHHCVLIYENPPRGADLMRPLVAKIVDNKAEKQWGFDAFLFLTYTINRKNTEIGDLNMGDFQTIIDNYFTPEISIDALNSAVQSVVDETGMPLPSKRKVMIAIPWMNPAVTQFGDVDGDGVVESLANQEGRDKVITWFVNQVKSRFADRFPMLELWGFYWMRENVSDTPEVVKAAAKIIHEHQLKLMWIPYYMATGFDCWQDYDIDVAIMQSNYTFTGYEMGGNIRSNRLYANAKRCLDSNLGFEIEQISCTDLPPERRNFIMQTLEQGHKDKLGYQHVPTAYYLGGAMEMYNSSDSEMRQLYYNYCDYLAGKPITVPRLDKWELTQNGSTTTATCTFEQPQSVANVDIFFDEDSNATNKWYGHAELFGKIDDEWQPIGWAVRGTFSPDELNFQCLTIPAGVSCRELKLVMSSTENLKISDIAIEANGKPMDLSSHCNKSVHDFNEIAPLIDSGKLNAYHSWQGLTELVRSYLTSPVVCDELKIKVMDRGDFQTNYALLINPNIDFCATNGVGALPAGQLTIPPVALKLFNDSEGELTFKLPQATELTRFALAARICFYSNIGEVTLLYQGKKVDHNLTSFAHNTTVNMGGKYYDDGVVATTGVINRNLNGMVTICGNQTVEFEINLGIQKTFTQIGVLSFFATLQKVKMAKELAVAFSNDGQNWSEFQPINVTLEFEERNILRPNWSWLKLPATTAKHLKFKVKSCDSDSVIMLKKYELF